MRFPTLLTADLHLVANPAAEYRWDLFPWLAKTCKEEKVKTLMILGDLTDAKDNHSAELVNRVVAAIDSLPVEDIKILVGNHDWLKRGHEYFRFLNRLPQVEYITKPQEDSDVNGPLTMYLPYSKNPAEEWKDLDFSHYEYLFMHQTMKGSVSSNGELMEGENLPLLNAGKVYSGDIHVPQVIAGVEYVGSPYHVHFGDAFKPRCVLLEPNGRPIDLFFETISRVTLKVGSLAELRVATKKLRRRDQVKLRVELVEAEAHGWLKMRREAVDILKDRGVEVMGVELIVIKSTRRLIEGVESQRPSYSPAESVERFVMAEELGGEALLSALEVLES